MIATRLLRMAIALVAAGAATLLAVGPAHAAPTSTSTPAQAATIWDCGYRADYGLYLFRSPTSTTADYFVGKGTVMYAPGCDIETGRQYSGCGGDNHWVRIAGTKHGWAPLACTTRVYRVVR